jgi:hypothetical protein
MCGIKSLVRIIVVTGNDHQLFGVGVRCVQDPRGLFKMDVKSRRPIVMLSSKGLREDEDDDDGDGHEGGSSRCDVACDTGDMMIVMMAVADGVRPLIDQAASG